VPTRVHHEPAVHLHARVTTLKRHCIISQRRPGRTLTCRFLANAMLDRMTSGLVCGGCQQPQS
jgi:hypothetical protein